MKRNVLVFAVVILSAPGAKADARPSMACPLVAPLGPGPGWAQSAPQFLPDAVRLDLQGQAAYQKRDHRQAERALEAALKADPTFLSPRVTLACIALREDKLNDAANVLAGLFRDGFVPWHQVALGDIDLARLWAHADETILPAATSAAAVAWGQRVEPGILLLSRLAPPVKLAVQDGPLIFRPAQEIVSWNPETGRYHQVTSEGGRVLVFLRSPNGHDVLYLTAQKVRRNSGRLHSFEGVGVHLLALQNMTLVSRRLGGVNDGFSKFVLRFDHGQAQIGAVSAAGVAEAHTLQTELKPLPTTSLPRAGSVVFTTAGIEVEGPTDVHRTAACQMQLKPDATAIPSVLVTTSQRAPLRIPTRFGVALHGLGLVQMAASL